MANAHTSEERCVCPWYNPWAPVDFDLERRYVNRVDFWSFFRYNTPECYKVRALAQLKNGALAYLQFHIERVGGLWLQHSSVMAIRAGRLPKLGCTWYEWFKNEMAAIAVKELPRFRATPLYCSIYENPRPVTVCLPWRRISVPGTESMSPRGRPEELPEVA